jgi:hypothetical protein
MDAEKSGSLGTRDGEPMGGSLQPSHYPAVAQYPAGTPCPPVSLGPHQIPPASMPSFIPTPGPMFQHGMPMQMYPPVNASHHPG